VKEVDFGRRTSSAENWGHSALSFDACYCSRTRRVLKVSHAAHSVRGPVLDRLLATLLRGMLDTSVPSTATLDLLDSALAPHMHALATPVGGVRCDCAHGSAAAGRGSWRKGLPPPWPPPAIEAAGEEEARRSVSKVLESAGCAAQQGACGIQGGWGAQGAIRGCGGGWLGRRRWRWGWHGCSQRHAPMRGSTHGRAGLLRGHLAGWLRAPSRPRL
jgi:hypothetical protein